MMDQWTMYMGGPYSILNWIFMILWWALIILAIVGLVKWFAEDKNVRHGKESAIDILEKRYAKGEIDKKEFAEKKKELNS